MVEYVHGMQILTVYNRGTQTYSLKPTVAQNDELITEAILENTDNGRTGIVGRKI